MNKNMKKKIEIHTFEGNITLRNKGKGNEENYAKNFDG